MFADKKEKKNTETKIEKKIYQSRIPETIDQTSLLLLLLQRFVKNIINAIKSDFEMLYPGKYS